PDDEQCGGPGKVRGSGENTRNPGGQPLIAGGDRAVVHVVTDVGSDGRIGGQLAAGQDRRGGAEGHVVGLTGGTITGSHVVDGRVVLGGVGVPRVKPTIRRHRFHEAARVAASD